MKNSSETNGNRTRDLPNCSAVPRILYYWAEIQKPVKGSDVSLARNIGYMLLVSEELEPTSGLGNLVLGFLDRTQIYTCTTR